MIKTQKYKEYIASEAWQLKARIAKQKAGNKCQHCFKDGYLEVHHLHYDNLYNEKPEDLEVLCKECHKKADKKRELDQEEEIHWKAVDTFASKKYGENWENYKDPYEVEEEFEEWLERKEYSDATGHTYDDYY